MTIHRCALPTEPPTTYPRVFNCPDCAGRYVWTKRMVGRQMREGWQRMGFDTLARIGQRPADPPPSWFKRWAALVATGYAVGFLVVVALVVWIVLRVTA